MGFRLLRKQTKKKTVIAFGFAVMMTTKSPSATPRSFQGLRARGSGCRLHFGTERKKSKETHGKLFRV